NSGDNRTQHFSNKDGSFMSSLGAFTAKETYMGGNGYSLRLEGLEPGFNDHARDRAIVIHGAPYVNPAIARLQGRLSRSLGCPAADQQPRRRHDGVRGLRRRRLAGSLAPARTRLRRSVLTALRRAAEAHYAQVDRYRPGRGQPRHSLLRVPPRTLAQWPRLD